MPTQLLDPAAVATEAKEIAVQGEEVMRLAGGVVSHLGRSGHSLATQRQALRLALAWMEKGPSFAKEHVRKKHDERHP